MRRKHLSQDLKVGFGHIKNVFSICIRVEKLKQKNGFGNHKTY